VTTPGRPYGTPDREDRDRKYGGLILLLVLLIVVLLIVLVVVLVLPPRGSAPAGAPSVYPTPLISYYYPPTSPSPTYTYGSNSPNPTYDPSSPVPTSEPSAEIPTSGATEIATVTEPPPPIETTALPEPSDQP